MKTLNAAFNAVYGKALEPLGFVKLKGKQPYFVRLIGDEILHVITYKNEWCMRPYKAFVILGGIATVYRRNLALDKNPKDNNGIWLTSNTKIYTKLPPYDIDDKYCKSIRQFEYVAESGKSLMEKPCSFEEKNGFTLSELMKVNDSDIENFLIEAVEHSLEVTKQFLLPALDKATDLRSCVEFYRMFFGSLLHIYTDEDFGKNMDMAGSNEGLLNLKVFNVDEYTEHLRNAHEKENIRLLHLMESGEAPMIKDSFEERKKRGEKGILKEIAIFEQLRNNPVLYAKVMQELENRKTSNIEILRRYGLKI